MKPESPSAETRIHPDLMPLAQPVGDLRPDPRNARLHDRRNTDAIKASYSAHGQLKPCVVQRRADDGTEMVVRAGNGSLAAVRELGWTHLACVVVDMNDRDAIAFALRDNRTAELADWDLVNLGASLEFLQGADVDLTSVGWSDFEYRPLLQADWSPPDNTGEEFTVPAKKSTITFTADQWAELKRLCTLGDKLTAEDILVAVRRGVS